MGNFIQLVVDGLSTGSIYAALALAIVLVNQATGLINFAQGGMAVLAAYVAWQLTSHGVPLLLAILLVDRGRRSCSAPSSSGCLIRRFEGGDPDTAVVVTIGLLTLITGVCGVDLVRTTTSCSRRCSRSRRSRSLGAVISIRSLGTIARDRRDHGAAAAAVRRHEARARAAGRRDQPGVRRLLRAAGRAPAHGRLGPRRRPRRGRRRARRTRS